MKKYRQAVSALVLRPSSACSRDGCTKLQSILLVHKPRTRDAWQLPQGGVEKGETMEQAALRELQEEVGLCFDRVTRVSGIEYRYDFPEEFIRRNYPCNDGQTLQFVVIEAPTDTKVIVDQNEIDAFVWVLPEELPKYIERKEYLEVIGRVIEEANSMKYVV